MHDQLKDRLLEITVHDQIVLVRSARIGTAVDLTQQAVAGEQVDGGSIITVFDPLQHLAQLVGKLLGLFRVGEGIGIACDFAG
ncbi:hypothetical protein IID10_18115 [candidate division KSB1 bacterium]|nr:hypothetical protein [candidate division KSB1 bacterium]